MERGSAPDYDVRHRSDTEEGVSGYMRDELIKVKPFEFIGYLE